MNYENLHEISKLSSKGESDCWISGGPEQRVTRHCVRIRWTRKQIVSLDLSRLFLTLSHDFGVVDDVVEVN